MNTKQAIEFLSNLKAPTILTDIKEGNGENIKIANNKIDKIINLLKRGEKYKATIIEIAKIADNEIYPYANDEERLKYILEEIEIMNKGGRRKYFPKEVIK